MAAALTAKFEIKNSTFCPDIACVFSVCVCARARARVITNSHYIRPPVSPFGSNANTLFSVRYEMNLYVKCRLISVFKVPGSRH